MVRLIAEGLTLQQIAERLGIAVTTTRSHVQMARLKLGVGVRVRLAAWIAARAVESAPAGRVVGRRPPGARTAERAAVRW